jgi:hypothetical protein
MRKLLYPLICLILLSGCDEDKWEGYLYPDKDNLTNHIKTGEFGTLEECRNTTISHAHAANYNNFDYECGLNCKYIQNSDYPYARKP